MGTKAIATEGGEPLTIRNTQPNLVACGPVVQERECNLAQNLDVNAVNAFDRQTFRTREVMSCNCIISA
jgi:hypothetical protein